MYFLTPDKSKFSNYKDKYHSKCWLIDIYLHHYRMLILLSLPWVVTALVYCCNAVNIDLKIYTAAI